MKFRTNKPILLAELLQAKIGCSMTKIKETIAQEAIFINDVLNTEPNPLLAKNSRVEIRKTNRLTDERIQILFEDKHLIAVEKPAGILTNKSRNDSSQTLFGKINHHLRTKSHNQERAFVVHRLDQKVSGVILFAKTTAAEKYLKENWYDFRKTYHALVEGCPKEPKGTIESWLTEDRHFKVHSGQKRPESKRAVTYYQIEKKTPNFTLLAITLGTGRKNQIRVHMADMGCHIAGDMKYGASTNPLNRIGLHAFRMELNHPATGKRMIIEAPTPFR